MVECDYEGCERENGLIKTDCGTYCKQYHNKVKCYVGGEKKESTNLTKPPKLV